MKRRLSVTNLSSENNLPMFRLNAAVVTRASFALMMTGAFSRNASKLFSDLKLVTDNLLFVYAGANSEATESCCHCCEYIQNPPPPLGSQCNMASDHPLIGWIGKKNFTNTVFVWVHMFDQLTPFTNGLFNATSCNGLSPLKGLILLTRWS